MNTNYLFVYNFDTRDFKIISNDEMDTIDADNEKYVNIKEELEEENEGTLRNLNIEEYNDVSKELIQSYIMCVNGIDTSDCKLSITTSQDFYKMISNYKNEFKTTPDIQYNYIKKIFNIVIHTVTFGSDLCSFSLYEIYKNNNKEKLKKISMAKRVNYNAITVLPPYPY